VLITGDPPDFRQIRKTPNLSKNQEKLLLLHKGKSVETGLGFALTKKEETGKKTEGVKGGMLSLAQSPKNRLYRGDLPFGESWFLPGRHQGSQENWGERLKGI